MVIRDWMQMNSKSKDSQIDCLCESRLNLLQKNAAMIESIVDEIVAQKSQMELPI